jgi:hypothetical protein
VPGASKLIAYRLSTSGINFNDISFVADRYHLDAKLSEHFNPANNQFVPTPLDANNNYAHPEDGYKYIIYPQIGVFR